MHRLRPEKPQFPSDGRGFDSPHLHEPLSQKGPEIRVVARIAGPSLCASGSTHMRNALARGGPGRSETALDAILRLDTHLPMVHDPVKRVDSMMTAWSVEARVPFLDQDLVRLAAACPPS
jgi:asparagine synthetase B (glutamine-hydrolysing)